MPSTMSGRLRRIAEAHHTYTDPQGKTWEDCAECGESWPCPTYIWATTPLDDAAPWNPEATA